MATKKTKTTVKKAPVRKTKYSSADIQKRAEQIYLKRIQAGKPGDELSDWLQAEKELKSV
ncbi:MAG: DUF2934 domain-containing protein [Bacteroidales bacterium]|nr:DUF2934 domain-containing protein [Bacteroidales bacterium]